MQALRVERLSPDLSGVALQDLPVPQPRPGEVLVRVRATSLNYPDLLMTRGDYQFKPEVPFTLGLELAGEVVSAPDGSGFAPGDRVVGGAKTGGMADYAALPATNLRRIPDGLSFAQAAAMGAAYSTAYTALVEIGRLQPGQWVLVHGASGGVGLAACDLAVELGAKVIAATTRAEKLERIIMAVPVDAAMLNTGRFREEVARLTDGSLCDIVFDPVGGDVFDESTRCVAFGGQLQV
ncbi:MAG: alcohol dehydrogenase catalytic domain-containing protein, partial [Sphingomonadaceae bacterium]